jgi:hypothetical protein
MWSYDYFSGETYLETTSLMARCIILELGEGEQQDPHVQRYALPEKNMSNGKRVWASGGLQGLAQHSEAPHCLHGEKICDMPD